MASENKLQYIIQTSLESLRTLVDSNTVIGNPIATESGTTIIPVSKISMGFASGGLDYSGKTLPQKQNFGGGGGTGLNIIPIGFLVVDKDGKVTDARVVKGVSDALDAEALKVVSASPKWKPGRVNGNKVRTVVSIPIEFKLEKKGSRSSFGIKKY